MKNSSARIAYISSYLTSYIQNIRTLNDAGMFDSTKMFELFAQEISSLWFGKDFKNLNYSISNYPYVDLVSTDGEIFVQVSTCKDIQSKIKETLEKIRDAKKPQFEKVTDVYFFMLDNMSGEKLHSYIGEEQIGNIVFDKDKHVILVDSIIRKSQTDLDFQISLYSLLKRDEARVSDNTDKLKRAITSGKYEFDRIDHLINGEYYIDRTAIIEEMRKKDDQFILITGEADCGKSALCWAFLKDHEFVLYTKAEYIASKEKIDDIWGFDVNQVFECIGNNKLYIFIDSLEFISDCGHIRIELLKNLYSVAARNSNIRIICACRTSEKAAYAEIISVYKIKNYEIGQLTDLELRPILDKYDVIRQMYDSSAYNYLIRLPFYINLIVTQKIKFNDIKDLNNFREYIWNNILCLKLKCHDYNIKSSDVSYVIEEITFTRAKNGIPGYEKDDIDSDILKALLSEGVVTGAGHLIRLKYDIYEDICFENYIDKQFRYSRGDYKIFYNELEQFGKCIYRRYQIWISNKLFTNTDRERFLYKLIIENDDLTKWQEQTEIGIVKSNFCHEFFSEYQMEIVRKQKLCNFVRICNLYAHELRMVKRPDSTIVLDFAPIGYGRQELIRIIRDNHIYKGDTITHGSVLKLCGDYIKLINLTGEIDESANKTLSNIFEIIKFYIETFFDELREKQSLSAEEKKSVRI